MNGRWLLVACCLFLVSFREAATELPHVDEPRERPAFGSAPPDCGDLYNVGKHQEWAQCMGVGYHTQADGEQ